MEGPEGDSGGSLSLSPDTRKDISKWDNICQVLKENKLLTPDSVSNRNILWKDVTMSHDES